ncbi:unnamed protein product [marine sediment metagenome]|uniref:Uncharacterized protein n=1 Tax=marine sediment metagenome TaxID=412755 RepID=X0XTE2_9ZZZZ
MVPLLIGDCYITRVFGLHPAMVINAQNVIDDANIQHLCIAIPELKQAGSAAGRASKPHGQGKIAVQWLAKETVRCQVIIDAVKDQARSEPPLLAVYPGCVVHVVHDRIVLIAAYIQDKITLAFIE